ncbi:MAG: hypothetical protein R3F43_14170 [bacterium]
MTRNQPEGKEKPGIGRDMTGAQVSQRGDLGGVGQIVRGGHQGDQCGAA